MSAQYGQHPTTIQIGRFFSRISIDAVKGCWLWTGAKSSTGYGMFCWRAKVTTAHRVAYMWFVGGRVKGLDVDHLCRVRACVNPMHLDAVTHGENVWRGLYGLEFARRRTRVLRAFVANRPRATESVAS